MGATIHQHPATRWTRIVCGVCLEVAPSWVASLRPRLIEVLAGAGWRLTLGEAVCPKCVAEESARRTG